MKHTFILLLLCISFGAVNAQFTIKKIIKPKNSLACDGKLVLEFKESELPAELVISSTMGNQNFTIDSKLFTISSLCPAQYTIEMTDNHECVTEEEVDLEECDLDISYEIKRYDCNEDAEKYNIKLIDLPEGQLYYEWSNGSTKSYLTRRYPGAYSVTVTDENGCNQELNINIESTKVSISNTLDPSEDGDGCDGRVSIQSVTENETFTIILKVDNESAYSEVITLGNEEFQIPIDLCYYNTNTIEIVDQYGCTQELEIELSFIDCSNLKLKVDELWHASNGGGAGWNNGIVKYKFLDPNLDPNNFEFKLYKECPACPSGWVFVESGIGKTEFNSLKATCEKYDWEDCEFDYEIFQIQENWDKNLSYWKCNYKMIAESVLNDDCKVIDYFTIRQCSNDIDLEVLSESSTNEDGNGYLVFSIETAIFNVNSSNLSYTLT